MPFDSLQQRRFILWNVIRYPMHPDSRRRLWIIHDEGERACALQRFAPA